MPDRVDFANQAGVDVPNGTAPMLAEVEGEQHKSYLQSGVDFAVDSCFDRQSAVGAAIKHYAPEVFKTAALFTPGRCALAATALLGAADEMRVGDSLSSQVAELGLGAAKGGLTKFAFDRIGFNQPNQGILGAPLKGVALGVASRSISLGFTPSTWLDSQGKFDAGSGVSRVLGGAINRNDMLLDASVFLVASGAVTGINKLAGGALDRSIALTTAATGATYGATGGGLAEIARERQAKQTLDWGQIGKASLIQAGINGVAALPGGVYSAHLAANNESVRASEKSYKGDALARVVSMAGIGLGAITVQRSGAAVPADRPDPGHLFSGPSYQEYRPDSEGNVVMHNEHGKIVALQEGDRAVFDNINGGVSGVGTVEVTGNSRVALEVPPGGTLRLVLKGEQTDPTIHVLDSSQGQIEVVNQRDTARLPQGLLDASGKPRPDVTVLDPLADVFSDEDIQNIRQVQKLINSRNAPSLTDQEMEKVAGAVYRPAQRQDRILHIVIGPPGAGKTTNFVNPTAAKYGATVIDGDEINPLLPGYDGGLGTVPLGTVSAQIRAITLNQAMENGDNIVFPFLGRKMDVMEAMINDARAHNYRIGVHLVDLPPEESARRVYRRAMQPADPVTGIRQVVDAEWALLRVGKGPLNVFNEIINRPGFVDEFSHFSSDVPHGEPLVHVRSSETTNPDGQLSSGLFGQVFPLTQAG